MEVIRDIINLEEFGVFLKNCHPTLKMSRERQIVIVEGSNLRQEFGRGSPT